MRMSRTSGPVLVTTCCAVAAARTGWMAPGAGTRPRGRGNDVLVGGAGDDRLDAREGASAAGRAAQAGFVDRVICGAGNDMALVDPGDVVDPGCENVVGGAGPIPPSPTAPTPPGPNHAPSGITLSNSTLPENRPPGTDVGVLAVSDVDAGQQHAFTLVAGPGDDDNAAFAIAARTLETADHLDFEDQPTYSIRVRATDNGTPAMAVETALTITLTDTLEPPTPEAVTETTAEDMPVTITLSATDPEGDDVTSFDTSDLENGTLGAIGPISCAGTPNVCSADVVFTPDSNYNGTAGFSYAAEDDDGVSASTLVSITVDPVNDAPVATDGNLTTDEDARCR